jgi:lauroyl/myristoyl acyltransferase
VGDDEAVPKALSPESHVLRRLAYAGARHGPSWFVRYSPRFIGAAFAALLPEQRRRVRDNLRLVHGRRSPLVESRDVVRTFAEYAACLAESLGAEREDARRARVCAEGVEHLEAALASGRGVVMVTAHAGAWDSAGRFLVERFGRPVVVVMQGEADARARAFHDQVRARSGVEVLIVGDDELSALPLLRHLRAGGVAACQIDRAAPSGRSIEVELFGKPFGLPEGPFRVAALAGALVLPLFARRAGYFDYELSIHPALDLPRRPSAEELTEAARKAASAMERFLREHPTQWFHFANGKNRPSSG